MTVSDATISGGKTVRQMPWLPLLRCPSCAGALAALEDALLCNNCTRAYSINKGVINLRCSGDADAGGAFDLGLPRIETPTPEGWRKAVAGYLAGQADASEMLDVLTAGRRQAWKVLLDLEPEARLLCLGSGMGSAVQSLAPHVGQLFVLEPNDSKLHLTRQRLQIFAHKDEVVLLAGREAGTLPFASGVFDGVVHAESAESGPSGQLLAEVYRVLKSGGQFLVLTDNRFNLSLPSGWWDRFSTSPLPLRSLMRSIGLLERWWSRGNGTQSLPGLFRAIRLAGFTESDAFGLWPGRSQLDEIIPLQSGHHSAGSLAPTAWKKELRRKAVFLPAYALVAQAGGVRSLSSREKILVAARRQLSGGRAETLLEASTHLITRKDKMIIQANWGERRVMVRVPLAPAASDAEARHAATLEAIAVSHPGLAPRLLAKGAVDGFEYRVETALLGTPLRRVMGAFQPTEVLGRVSGLLERLNPAASLRAASLVGEDYQRLVEQRLERVFPLIPDEERQARLRAFFQQQLHGAVVSFGFVHGDFSASNILVSGAELGLIDWEASATDDLPILDAIGYLESVMRSLRPGHSLAESFGALARWELPSEAEEQFLKACYRRTGIDADCHPGLVYLRWLRQVDYLLPYWLRYSPDGQRCYINKVVEVLLKGEWVR